MQLILAKLHYWRPYTAMKLIQLHALTFDLNLAKLYLGIE